MMTEPAPTQGSSGDPVDRRRPRDRPRAAARAVIAGLAALALVAAGVLLLSDRAPDVLRTLFGERARELSRRIDARANIELDPGRTIPDIDVVVHVAMWAGVMFLIGLALWSWRGLPVAMAAVAGSSLAIELAQGRWSRTRAVESEDMIGNVSGVVLGGVSAAACYAVWSAGAALRRRHRPRT
ncbi:MAG: VanZ family protein [Ilumatobacter sp.]|nr:VanZ family protein [Ilumatobacter sp.]